MRSSNPHIEVTDSMQESLKEAVLTLPTFGIPTMPVLRAMLTTEVLQRAAMHASRGLAQYIIRSGCVSIQNIP